MRKFFDIGGIIAGVVLIAFGVAAIAMGFDGRTTVRDSLKAEQITFGAADDPAVAKYASQWADEQVTTGTQARAFAQVMHEHALEGAGGLTYSQMGRFVSAADPENAAGTSDDAAALKDDKGAPVPNSARNTWVTATALSTALNMSYMAEQTALFGIVVGFALLLSGIGFIVLTLALGGALGSRRSAELAQKEAVKTTVATVEQLSPCSLTSRAAPAAFGVSSGGAMPGMPHDGSAPASSPSSLAALVTALATGLGARPVSLRPSARPLAGSAWRTRSRPDS